MDTCSENYTTTQQNKHQTSTSQEKGGYDDHKRRTKSEIWKNKNERGTI